MNTQTKIRDPFDHEAERAVIGCSMLSERALDDAIASLTPEDFHDKRNRQAFDAMRRLAEQKTPVDEVTVGGLCTFEHASEHLNGIIETTPGAENHTAYIEVVRDKSARRAIIAAAHEACMLAVNSDESPSIIADQSAALISSTVIKHHDVIAEPASDMVTAEIKFMEELAAGRQRPGLRTGFFDIDERLGGLEPGDVIIVAGRPSMGKTALAFNMAQGCAERGAKTAIFELEMSRRAATHRLIASTARVNLGSLRNGKLDQKSWRSVIKAADEIHRLPLHIACTADLTALQLRSRARRLKAQNGGLDLIVLDYLQLMATDNPRLDRERQVAEISRSIKTLAMEMQIPIIVLSQLSRRCEMRPDKRPIMSDLRESGSLEQDADAILFVYRDDYYNPQTEKRGVAEIIFGKARNAEAGGDPVELMWRGSHTRFDNIESHQKDEAQRPLKLAAGYTNEPEESGYE